MLLVASTTGFCTSNRLFEIEAGPMSGRSSNFTEGINIYYFDLVLVENAFDFTFSISI